MKKGGKREGSGRKLISGKDIKVKLPYDLIYELNDKIDGITTAEKVRNALTSHIKDISLKKFSVIDLFCGVGGFSYGFEMNKSFDVVLGADIWDVALKTFAINHHATTLIKDDIREIKQDFWENLKDKIDVIIAGPPCQGFSMSGKRDINDKRNTLFEEVVKITEIIQPKFVIIENVVGLLSMTNNAGELIKDIIIRKFSNIGYKIEYKILNAADYGVPQSRKRVIFIASKNYKINFPKPILCENNYVSVGDALGNIDPNGDYYLEPKTMFQKLMSGKSLYIENHSRRKSNKLVTERMSFIPQGGNRKDIPEHLGTGGGVHSNAYKRLDPSKPSVTIKHAAKAMIIHPSENRILTVRECARLQSFPDDFIFLGNNSDQHQQLANAVPPLLGKAIADQIYEDLKNA